MRAALCSILLLTTTTTVAAADPAPAIPEPIWVAAVTATSTFADKHDAYNPRLVLEPKTTFDAKTGEPHYLSAWCEGKKDEGIGEGITIKLARPTAIDKVTIKPGVWLTQALFDANNTITALDLVTDDGRTLHGTPSGKREELAVPVGGAPISSITVKIAAVKKGKMNDSCISEITFGDAASIATGFDAAAAAAFVPEATVIWATLFAPPAGTAACDATKVAKFTDFPFTYDDVENTHAHDDSKRFIHHPHTFKTAAAFEKACKDGSFLEPMSIDSVGPVAGGKVGLSFMLAEATETLVLAWKGGHWRLATIR